MQRNLYALLILVLVLAACTPAPAAPANETTGKLPVIATTSLVADAVARVGGDLISLTTLLPLGSDPHSFQPTPQEIALVSQAEVLFLNGMGLEEFMTALTENMPAEALVVEVSDGITPLEAAETDHEHEDEEHEHEHDHAGGDPHTWMDPNNVIVWVDNIAAALSQADPANAATYTANAAAYRQELSDLDAWVRQELTAIPEANRKLVTDHTVFTYFADEYGFEQVGAVIPGYSTVSEPSAQELAALEDTIRELGVPAIFVGESVNPALAQRVAEDTGSQLIQIYHASLSAPGGAASTYLDFIRYNVRALVSGLRQ